MKRLMKLTVSLVLIVTVLLMGCASAPQRDGVTYSFAEGGSPSATINFDVGELGTVSFIDYNGEKLPKPVEKTYWNKEIVFPAEKPQSLTVRSTSYTAPTPMLDIAGALGRIVGGFSPGSTGTILDLFLLPVFLAFVAVPLPFLALALVVDLPIGLAMNFDKKVALDCPPLEADRTYSLRLVQIKRPRKLMLVEAGTGTVVYEKEF